MVLQIVDRLTNPQGCTANFVHTGGISAKNSVHNTKAYNGCNSNKTTKTELC